MTSKWDAISEAPHGVTLLTRSGANLVFAGYTDKWQRDDGKTVNPELWLNEEMEPMITLKIDVTKISKEDLYHGKKGIYLDLALLENKDGADDYGNDGFIVQDIPAEKRKAGMKGPIIGNWRHKEVKSKAPESRSALPF